MKTSTDKAPGPSGICIPSAIVPPKTTLQTERNFHVHNAGALKKKAIQCYDAKSFETLARITTEINLNIEAINEYDALAAVAEAAQKLTFSYASDGNTKSQKAGFSETRLALANLAAVRGGGK